MQFANGIYGIEFRTDLDVPASVNPTTGIIYVSAEYWKILSPEIRFFVLLHEYMHVHQKTTSEPNADSYAFAEYQKRGYSEKKAIQDLIEILPFDNCEHYERVTQMVRTSLADGKII